MKMNLSKDPELQHRIMKMRHGHLACFIEHRLLVLEQSVSLQLLNAACGTPLRAIMYALRAYIYDKWMDLNTELWFIWNVRLMHRSSLELFGTDGFDREHLVECDLFDEENNNGPSKN